MLVYIEIGRFGEALVELGYDNSTRKLVCLRATNPVADYVIIARLVVGARVFRQLIGGAYAVGTLTALPSAIINAAGQEILNQVSGTDTGSWWKNLELGLQYLPVGHPEAI